MIAAEDTENTKVSGSIAYLAIAACKTGFCRGVLPSSTGPRMLARLGMLPETMGGKHEYGGSFGFPQDRVFEAEWA